MKRITFLIAPLLVVLLVGPVQKASAQYYFYDNDSYDTPLTYELGGSVSIMNCLTDLGGRKGIGKKFVKDLNFGNNQIAGGAYILASYKNAVSLRLEATFGSVKAYDSILKDVKESTWGRYERNLSFKSKISEISLVAEFHPLYIFIDWPSRDGDPPKFSPYLMGGIGYYSFNPKTQLGDKWIDLQPLSTEGQGFAEYPDRKPYKLKQLNFPVGLGLRYELSPMVNLRLELLYRILSTDYLDDASTRYIDPQVYKNYFNGTRLTNALILNLRNKNLNPHAISAPGKIRGDPKDNDAYFTANLKVGITFGRERIN